MWTLLLNIPSLLGLVVSANNFDRPTFQMVFAVLGCLLLFWSVIIMVYVIHDSVFVVTDCGSTGLFHNCNWLVR